MHTAIIVVLAVVVLLLLWQRRYDALLTRFIRIGAEWKGPGRPPFIVQGWISPSLWQGTDPDDIYGLEYVESIAYGGRPVISVYRWNNYKLDRAFLRGTTTPD